MYCVSTGNETVHKMDLLMDSGLVAEGREMKLIYYSKVQPLMHHQEKNGLNTIGRWIPFYFPTSFSNERWSEILFFIKGKDIEGRTAGDKVGPVNRRELYPGHDFRSWRSWATGPHHPPSPVWNGLKNKPMSGAFVTKPTWNPEYTRQDLKIEHVCIEEGLQGSMGGSVG